MVAFNPLFNGRWTLQRFNSTILSDIWPEVLLFSAFAAMVSLVTEKTEHKLGLNSQLLTVSGVVLGLVISFRTSSAYERFQDGSKMWTNIVTASRTLAQQIWIHVPDHRETDADGSGGPQAPLEAIIEKKTMLNLIHAFAVSVKHLLRGEPGVFYEDLYPLVAFLPKYATPTLQASDILPIWHIHGGRRLVPATVKRKDTLFDLVELESPPLKPAHNPANPTVYDYFPILRFGRWLVRIILVKSKVRPAEAPAPKKKRIAYSEIVESTVPLELYLVLSNYTAFLMRNNLVQLPIANGMTASLSTLHDSLAHLERICNNPLPFAYQAHLRMCLWLYLLLLPFQLVEMFGYLTIPATAFVAFLLIGFLEIGQEIENPFNYGLNDLDLDWYCHTIQRELQEIATQTNLDPSAYMFQHANRPFAPFDTRGTDLLLDSPDGEYHPVRPGVAHGMEGIRQMLVQNWKQVDHAMLD